jgi:hypothetical protein
VIALNDEDTYSPGLWSRFDWTWDADGELYYCQSVYDAETEEAAVEGDDASDASELDAGCAGFSWTMLSPMILL